MNYMAEVADYMVTMAVTTCGTLLAAYGAYRFLRSVFESSLFYLCGGAFLVLTFNREVRFRVINKLPSEVRKYLYEKTAVDAIVDLSVAIQSVGAILMSGVLRKEEIHRLTNTLPREYQFLNQRGLVHLLPEPVQGMLNPFYSLQTMRANRGAQLVIEPPQEVPVVNLPDPAADGDVSAENGLRRRRLERRSRDRDRGPIAHVVRGLEVSSTHYDAGSDLFVPPGSPTRAPLVPATVVTENEASREHRQGPFRPPHGHTREGTHGVREEEQPHVAIEAGAARLRDTAPGPPQVEEVLLEIGLRRLKEAATSGKDVVLSGVEYCVTGGDLSDGQLLSSFLGLGMVGGILGNYDASGPMSRLGADLGGIERDDVRVSGGRIMMRYLLSPFNKAVQSLPPLLYGLSVASGGMLAARLSRRHDVYGVCNRVALRPLFTLLQDCHARSLHLYRSLTRDTDWHRANVAAVVTTLAVLVAWRMRQTWRQWRWLIAVLVARVKAQVERQAQSIAGYFQ